MIKYLFSFFLFITTCVNAGLFSAKPKFLAAGEAFVFSAAKQENALLLNWQIADGYYLYKKEINVRSAQSELAPLIFPASEQYSDEFFGEVDIFRHQLEVTLPLEPNQQSDIVEVRYQGCTKGFCYPPEMIEIELAKVQAVEKSQTFTKVQQIKSEQSQLAAKLAENRFSIFWFFILGLGLAFTPCVLPMLPLLSAVVIGNQNRPSTFKALLLSFSYVQGMALTYTLLGLVVAAIGLPFQVALQSPPVLIGLAVVFTLLAFSMFGLFELQLPNSWRQKLNAISQKQQGGAFGSVFLMGMIAGLIASPCTSAPLSGALLYVAQSGDLVVGGFALYLLALGMGIPLILITLFGNKILPKSGEWLLKVKTAFGFVMLALPVFLLSRVLPSDYEPFLWSALAVAFLVWLADAIPSASIFKRILKVLLLIILVFAAKPWTNLVWNSPNSTIETTQQLKLQPIKSLADLEKKLLEHKGKKVMLDLYADWCVACKEFEKYTFSDIRVQAKLAEMLVLQVDMTRNSSENKELMQRFNVLGLPTILFFDEDGNEMTESRITGFLAADGFLAWLAKL